MDRFGLTSGTEFGGYRIVDTLGSGGMGTVYHAVDADGHHVALKLLHPVAAADPDARARLRREVSALQRIRHPQVARVLDAETDSAEAFIVTELIPGISLGQRIRRSGRIPPAELADLAESLTQTLHAVHAAGVLHRDLKPGNVMLGPHGPVLIDFGIAHDGSDAKVTATGMIVGTPGYIPPESVAGERPSEAGDWWSLAAVLAYAGTGRPPYGSGSWEVVLARLVGGEPDLTGLDAPVAKALSRALDPVPAHRRSPDELVSDLRAAAQSLGQTRPSASPIGPAGAGAVAGATSLAAAATAADGVQAGDAHADGASQTEAVPYSATAMVSSNTPTDVLASSGADAASVQGEREAQGLGSESATEVVGGPGQPCLATGDTELLAADSPTGLISSDTPTDVVAGGLHDPATETPTRVAPAGLPPYEQAGAPPTGEPIAGGAAEQIVPVDYRPYSPPLVQPYQPPAMPAYPAAQPYPQQGYGLAPGGPYPQQGYPQQQLPAPPPPEPDYPWRQVRHRPGTLLALAAALSFAATYWPSPCVAIALIYLLASRTVARAASATQWRRYRKGAREGETWRTAVGLPWYFVRAIFGLLPSLILAAAIAVAAGWLIASFVSLPVPGTDLDLSVAASVLVPLWLGLLTCWWGPNSQATRRGGRLIVDATIPARLSVLVVLVALAACCAIIFGWWTIGAPPGISWPTFHVG